MFSPNRRFDAHQITTYVKKPRTTVEDGYKSPSTVVSKEDQGWPREVGSGGKSGKNWESFGKFRTHYGSESDPSWRNTGRRRRPGASTPNGDGASTALFFVCGADANGTICPSNLATTAWCIVGFNAGTEMA